MTKATANSKDAICGMTLDEATALHAERNGKTFYFCSDHYGQKFLSASAGIKPKEETRARGSCVWCPSWCPFCAREDEAGGKRPVAVVDNNQWKTLP